MYSRSVAIANTVNGFDVGSSADGVVDGDAFTAGKEGQTILLYRYRPDPTEVANGDESKEAVAVRIVESFSQPRRRA